VDNSHETAQVPRFKCDQKLIVDVGADCVDLLSSQHLELVDVNCHASEYGVETVGCDGGRGEVLGHFATKEGQFGEVNEREVKSE